VRQFIRKGERKGGKEEKTSAYDSPAAREDREGIEMGKGKEKKNFLCGLSKGGKQSS